VSLEHVDKVTGPEVLSAWQPPPEPVVIETLAYSSPSVLSDGTLVWTSWAGKTRALATDGGVTWEADAVEGVALVNDDDVTYWAGPTPLGRDKRGALVWAPRYPAEWTPRSIPQDEGTRVGPLIPVAYNAHEQGGVVALHRSTDGEIQWSVSTADGGLDGHAERVAFANDGTLFVTTPTSDFQTQRLTAYGYALQRRWSIESSALQFAPIPGQRSERLFTVTRDCRVNVLDRDGNTLASHQMLGRAFRYLPKLVDGVLYVMAEVPVPEKLTANQLAHLTRPDGGTIDPDRDYDCVLGRAVMCPPIEAGPFFILYAFQVE
jgi:outer membrane protein assembly factor BamB